MQIWKFVLEADGKQTIEMPKDANVLCVQLKDSRACLWAEVEPKAPKEKRMFEVFPTGITLPGDMGVSRKYISTFQIHSEADGSVLAFHVYERLN